MSLTSRVTNLPGCFPRKFFYQLMFLIASIGIANISVIVIIIATKISIKPVSNIHNIWILRPVSLGTRNRTTTCFNAVIPRYS